MIVSAVDQSIRKVNHSTKQVEETRPAVSYTHLNSNHITVSFKASPLEKQLITTDRMELNQILQEKMAKDVYKRQA